MKQPDSMDIGTRMDVTMHRLRVAKEDLDTAYLTFNAGQYRGANNRAYYSIYHTISAVLAKERVAFKRHKDTLGYFNKNLENNDNNSISQNDIINADVKEEILPASYYIEKYSYLVDNVQIPNFIQIFQNGITKDTITNNLKLQIAYKNLDETDKEDNGTVISIASEKILTSYQNICGDDEIIEFTNFEYENLKFLYFNDTFIAGKENADNTLTAPTSTTNYQLVNAYKQDNILTFDVKFEGQETIYKYSFKEVAGIYYFDKIVK